MDFRRVFLTYLEAPKSILAKNQNNWSNFIKFTDFPLPPFRVPWAAVIIINIKHLQYRMQQRLSKIIRWMQDSIKDAGVTGSSQTRFEAGRYI